MPYKLVGSWKKGFAFALHTVSSTYLGPNEFGHDQFANKRSEMGELVYKLKYKCNQSAIPKIIKLLENIKGIEEFDFIVPVPSSKKRDIQPVDSIALALGKQRHVPVLTDFLEKVPGEAELKNTTDPEQRAKLLKDTIKVTGNEELSGKRILLVDDLYRSGATLNACCSVLREQADIESVSVLTMTKTRSNR